jgi:hypothetical protein
MVEHEYRNETVAGRCPWHGALRGDASRARRALHATRVGRGKVAAARQSLMTSILLFAALLFTPACVSNETQAQGQAVEAVFTRAHSDIWHDSDPVVARAASWGRVAATVDSFPWNDRLVETLPITVQGPVTPAAATAPALSADLVDSDPVGARGWR